MDTCAPAHKFLTTAHAKIHLTFLSLSLKHSRSSAFARCSNAGNHHPHLSEGAHYVHIPHLMPHLMNELVKSEVSHHRPSCEMSLRSVNKLGESNSVMGSNARGR